jgi:hypothetical protein
MTKLTVAFRNFANVPNKRGQSELILVGIMHGNWANKAKLDIHGSVHHNVITKMTNKMQLCRMIYFSLTALHVSSDIFAHHQERLKCIYSFWFYSRMSLPGGSSYQKL